MTSARSPLERSGYDHEDASEDSSQPGESVMVDDSFDLTDEFEDGWSGDSFDTEEDEPTRGRLRRALQPALAVAAALLLILGVVAAVNGAIRIRSGYFATVTTDHLKIFKGQQGSFLWFHPTLAYSANQTSDPSLVTSGSPPTFPDLPAARSYVQEVTTRTKTIADEKQAVAAQEQQAQAESAATQAVYPQVNNAIAAMQQANTAWNAIWPCAPGGSCTTSWANIAHGISSGVLPAFQNAAAIAQSLSSSDPSIQSFLSAFQACASSALTFANTANSESSGTDWPPENSMVAMNAACNTATTSQPRSSAWQYIDNWPDLLFANYTKS